MADPGPARYLAICAGGLEFEAVEATAAFLRWAAREHAAACSIQAFSVDGGGGDKGAAAAKVLGGAAAVAKLVITTPRTLPVMTVLRIPYFMCVLALVGEAHALPNDTEEGLPYIEAAVRDAEGWSGALTTWAAAQDALAKAQPPPSPSPSWSERVAAFLADESSTASLSLRFRASAVRDGEHVFNKPQIMPVIGAGVAARLGEAALVNLTQYHMEVVGLILGRHMHVGLMLDMQGGRATFRATIPTEPANPPLLHRGLIATLRPSTAALLCFAARPQAGDFLCDFMVGVGTVPLVAATTPALPPVFGLGGDRDPLAGECAAKNYRSLVDDMGGKGARAGLLRWDARRLPLRDACLDVAIVDVPFGKKHKVKGGNLRHLYGQALRECARSMRPGGRLLVLAAGAKAVVGALQDRYNQGCWRPWEGGQEGACASKPGDGGGTGGDWAPRPVNIGGLLVFLFFAERTADTLPDAPPPVSQRQRQQQRQQQQQQKKQRTE